MPSKIEDIVQRLLNWFQSAARDLPWRRTTDPYAVWVSEIMLQQTQVKTVIPYWERWLRTLPTVRELAQIDSRALHKLWEGLGYYTRVRNMQAAARMILTQHAGEFPRDHGEVLALPGVGPYTAGAICSIAFDQPTPILDGNVIRVLSRLFAVAGDPGHRATRDQLWTLAGQLVGQAGKARGRRAGAKPARPCSELNQALMELGALVCLPREARCHHCPLCSRCAAFGAGRVNELPQTRRRPRATARRFAAFVLRNGSRYLVRQRPAQVVNAHLWEFPNVETDEKDPGRAARIAGLRVGRLAPMTTIKHSITRYRIRVDVYQGVDGEARGPDARWHTLASLQRLPFTSAHKRILDRLPEARVGGREQNQQRLS